MPTPIGHSLAGYAAAKLTRVQVGASERRLFLLAAVFSVLPDVVGMLMDAIAREPHHGFSHSFAALGLVSVLAAWLGQRAGWRFWPLLLFVAAAYGSHLVADLLRPAVKADGGEQLFWPLPRRYGISLNILPHVPGWGGIGGLGRWLRGIGALVLREIIVLAPIALACRFIRPGIPARSDERARAAATGRAAA